MIVECPSCHRRYEPKEGEKYCPCCGEKINEPLKRVDSPTPAPITQAPTVQPKQLFSNRGRTITLIACLLALLSLLFIFAPSITGYIRDRYDRTAASQTTQSLFQLTFFAKYFTESSSNPSMFIGLIVAFIAYLGMYGIVIYNLCRHASNRSNNGRVVAGVVELFVVVFYIIYILAKFNYVYSSGSGSNRENYVYMPTFQPAFIMFLGSLTTSAILNFVAAKID